MAVTPAEHPGAVRLALREIVAEHGPEALSSPAVKSNLLKDLLPDSPRVARMLVAAAEDHVADELRGHVAQGLDADTAAGLAASLFASATMFSPESCAWVVGELAVALGLTTEAADPGSAMPLPPEPLPPEPRRANVTMPAANPARPEQSIERPSAPGTTPGTLPDSAPPAPPAPPALGHRRPTRWIAVIAVAGALIAAAAITTTALLAGGSVRMTAYVTNMNGTVTPIDLGTGHPGRPIRVGSTLGAIAIAPDGKTAYAADPSNGTVIPVDLATGTPGQAITFSFDPAAIAITPDGKTAYVISTDGTVTPIDLATGQPSTPINAGGKGAAIAVTPDGNTAYVIDGNAVVPIDLVTGKRGQPITTAKNNGLAAIASTVTHQ